MDRTEQMSTQALEALLHQDFQDQEGGASDMSELLQAAQALAQREPQSRRPDPDRAWQSFVKEYLPFVPASRRYGRLRRMLRTAVVCAVVLLLLTTTAAAMGYDLWGMLAGWTDEILYLQPDQITPIQPEDITVPARRQPYDGLQQALEAYGFPQRVLPRWLPEGFELVSVNAYDESLPYMLMFQSFYRRGDETLIVGADVHIGQRQSSAHWQKDEGDPIAYKAGGKIHAITTNCGAYYTVWANGPLECFIYGDVALDELEHMIDSLYQSKNE